MSRTRLLILLTILAGGLAGCSDQEATGGGDEAAAQDEDREMKARQLFATATGKIHKEKIAYFEKLLSLYPESPLAPEAYIRLIGTLRHPSIGRADDALEKTRVFAHRHPKHRNAIETWWWMALHWKDDAERGPTVRKEWKAWLDDSRAKVEDGDDLDYKGFLWLHSAYAAHWHGDKKGALALLDEAASWDVPDKNTRAQIAFRTGSYRAELGDRAEAREAFQKALALVNDGAKGVSKQAVETELESLTTDGE